jgi:hypothetical protein
MVLGLGLTYNGLPSFGSLPIMVTRRPLFTASTMLSAQPLSGRIRCRSSFVSGFATSWAMQLSGILLQPIDVFEA